MQADIFTLNETLFNQRLNEEELHYRDTDTLFWHICRHIIDERTLLLVNRAHPNLLSLASLKYMLEERMHEVCQICAERFDATDESTGIIIPSIIVPCCGKRVHIPCFERNLSIGSGRCPNCRVIWTQPRFSTYASSHQFPDALAYIKWIDWRKRIDDILLADPIRAIVLLITALRGELADIVKEYALNKLFELTNTYYMPYTNKMRQYGIVELLMQLINGSNSIQTLAISLLRRLVDIDAAYLTLTEATLLTAAEAKVAAAIEAAALAVAESERMAEINDSEESYQARAIANGYIFPVDLHGYSSWLDLRRNIMSTIRLIEHGTNHQEREAAVDALSHYGPAIISVYGSVVLCKRIQDNREHVNVRCKACIAIGTLLPADISIIAEELKETLDERTFEPDVIRALLFNVFDRLEPIELQNYFIYIVHYLSMDNDNDMLLQLAAWHVLSKLATFASISFIEAIRMQAIDLEQYHIDATLHMLHDQNVDVRVMALRTMRSFSEDILMELRQHRHEIVRQAAHNALDVQSMSDNDDEYI
jgi:hypothetical protein